MSTITEAIISILEQLQKPTLAFLIGGMLLAAIKSKLVIPDAVYKFIVIVLLLKVGIGAGISVREANFIELAVPAIGAILLGVSVVALGGSLLKRQRGIAPADAMATAGLFGAVSASTLAVGMASLEQEGVYYEAFIGALYPFMDVAALLTAIVLAKLSSAKQSATGIQADGTAAIGGKIGGVPSLPDGINISGILIDTVRSPAISALFLGLAVGFYASPKEIYESFYSQLFYGLLSLLMLTMGMEAWERLSELKKVAHVYLLYGLLAPLVHGLIGLGIGLVVHHFTGFSQGGIVLLAVLAASSSDISGPPTLRASLPEANPSTYIAVSTGLGTPIAILTIPVWIKLAEIVTS